MEEQKKEGLRSNPEKGPPWGPGKLQTCHQEEGILGVGLDRGPRGLDKKGHIQIVKILLISIIS